MITHAALEQDGLTHGFFTREGGVSEGIYRGLNCGLGSDDLPDRVLENRNIAMQRLGLSGKNLVGVHQVHSADVVTLSRGKEQTGPEKADALVTDRPGIALGILTADCVPVLFADPTARVIGAAHSGWKGACGNISANVVEAMVSLGAKRENIRAIVGPAIQQPSYEVGPEFPDHFKALDFPVGPFFTRSAAPGHYLFDLTGLVLAQLQRLEIGYADRICRDTFTDEEDFFSYRRTTKRCEPDYGRQLSAIALVE
ncbi:peptidoglycan editing factor PgeF [Sneathiella chinensis]|uniref:Purine nucleoside phosphorylase n=1 Tax=Sneathiella chinensis TaxID=349750 RepID=A0ABQ5U246_9PROT|nr:peptidoglycan editing factor PgeF [Sneathiella chinensis]GLQ06229.1 laccase domain protein [Sneathiella chinensis]